MRCAVVAASALLALTGCGVSASQSDDGLRVVASTPLIADLVAGVAGDRAQVTSLVPEGADPHSYEPSLRDVRDIAYADLAFTNGLLLEQQKLVRTIEANLPEGAPRVAVAEGIEAYGGELIPIVEDASLDSIWLGLRVQGAGGDVGSADAVTFSASRAEGPGQLAAFVTGTFGAVEKVADSQASGAQVEERDGALLSRGDLGSTELPLQAHTHLSWAFTAPGFYELDLAARANGESPLKEVPATTLYFAVGVDPQPLVERLGEGTGVLDAGHADVTAKMDTGELVIRTDSGGQVVEHDPARTVVAVPTRTLQELPSGSQYRFLGKPGSQVYLLAQAVLGKHVHGEIDPHIWHSVPNAVASVQLMRDTLVAADPAGAATYRANADALVAELLVVDAEIRALYASLPDSGRQLITTHDGYRYLAQTYGLTVAGYVSPGPGVEPSIQQRERLRRTIEDLQVPALYAEKGILTRTPILEQVGLEAGVRVCELYSDSLDDEAPHYVDLMRKNAQTIRDCAS